MGVGRRMCSEWTGKGKQRDGNESQEQPEVSKEFTAAKDPNCIVTQGHEKLWNYDNIQTALQEYKFCSMKKSLESRKAERKQLYKVLPKDLDVKEYEENTLR